jgi:hypothetical protein
MGIQVRKEEELLFVLLVLPQDVKHLIGAWACDENIENE